jgi:hypothetical protein
VTTKLSSQRRNSEIQALLSKPGIQLEKQPNSTHLLIETTQAVYELKTYWPEKRLVSIVESSDPRVLAGSIAELMGSAYGAPEDIFIPGWIGEGLRMHFRFKNGIHPTHPVTSASISGNGWRLDVINPQPHDGA